MHPDTTTPHTASSFEDFCAQVTPRLRAHVARNTRSPEDARDVCQEVLARAWARWDTVSRYDAPASWAVAVANNLLADGWRREQRRLAALPQLVGPAGEQHDPATSLVVRDAVLTLTPDVREAVLLYYFEDWSLAGIAAAAGVPSTTVKHRLHRGRQALRSRLEEVGVSRAVA
jgi:RNA polymerase sigma-70 factor (ECF subfamily)